MKGFDFDKTLYRGDSTLDFYFFSLRKQPRCLYALPPQIWGALLFATKRISRDRFKAYFYRFLCRIREIDELITAFWGEHGQKLNTRVMERVTAGDLVISASPSFLLQPFCNHLGTALIASEVDKATGELLGPNCRGEEKVRRFRATYGDLTLDEFYTDSIADAPMTFCAKTSYLVEHGRIESFPST